MIERQLTTELPPVVTEVDRQFFKRADQLVRPGKNWYSYYGDDPDTEFLHYLAPTVRKFRRYVLDKTGVRPRRIDIRYESFVVEPDQDALFGEWHVDSGVGVVGISSDALTPQAVASEHPLAARYLSRHMFTKAGAQTVNDGIEEGWLHIHRPAPYEVIDISERVHRSSSNDTGVSVTRHYMALITPELDTLVVPART